jgi:hypothetical protein
MNNFLPGDIRFFRQQIAKLNDSLVALNKNLVILSERVSDEVEATVPSHKDSGPTTLRPGTWTSSEGESLFQVNTHLFMRTHQIKGEKGAPKMNGRWAGFLEVMDGDGVILWEITQTDNVFDDEESCRREIERLTKSFLDEWDANCNPIGED